eukprot:3213483-Pyramimonas_sp.AAC.1
MGPRAPWASARPGDHREAHVGCGPRRGGARCPEGARHAPVTKPGPGARPERDGSGIPLGSGGPGGC